MATRSGAHDTKRTRKVGVPCVLREVPLAQLAPPNMEPVICNIYRDLAATIRCSNHKSDSDFIPWVTRLSKSSLVRVERIRPPPSDSQYRYRVIGNPLYYFLANASAIVGESVAPLVACLVFANATSSIDMDADGDLSFIQLAASAEVAPYVLNAWKRLHENCNRSEFDKREIKRRPIKSLATKPNDRKRLFRT